MSPRRSTRAPALALAVVALAPAGAQAEVVVRDTGIDRVRALGGLVLYHRAGDGPDHRRVVDGRERPAEGVPARALPSAIGRDAAGRVVVAMSVTTVRAGRVVDRDWWSYDIRRDRARRLAVPDAAEAVSVWRGRLAYTVANAPEGSRGVFVQERGRARKVIGGTPTPAPLHLRGRLLLAVMDDGLGSTSVWRLEHPGAKRARRLPGSFTTEEWSIGALGTIGQAVTWSVAPQVGADPGGVIGVRLNRSGAPGRPGAVPASDLPKGRLRVWALDGRRLYIADRRALHRERLARAPESAPAANDDFANATPIGTDPPIARMPIAGNATTEEDDPVEDTVWYRFEPTVTQRVALRAGYAGTGFRSFVFEGDALASLTRVQVTRTDEDARFDVVAGRTYHLAVAAPFLTTDYEFARYVPFRLELDVADD